MIAKEMPQIISNLCVGLNLNYLICYSIFFSLSLFLSLCLPLSTDQRLDLNKLSPNDSDTVRGQIVGEFW